VLQKLGVHFGTGIAALIINAFIGAIILLLILRLVGGGWGYRRVGGGVGASLNNEERGQARCIRHKKIAGGLTPARATAFVRHRPTLPPAQFT
jgi:hypothetical protein